jgi:hypothetical protein
MYLVNRPVAALAELVDLVELVGRPAQLLVLEAEVRRGDGADDLAGAVHVCAVWPTAWRSVSYHGNVASGANGMMQFTYRHGDGLFSTAFSSRRTLCQ